MGTDNGIFQLGSATVTVINVGDLEARLGQWFKQRADGRPIAGDPLFAQPLHVPISCIHVALGDLSVLVDASAYDFAPDYPYLPSNYRPPADLVTQLEQHNIRPETLTHVVITHAHGDHFNGTTRVVDGTYEPVFPAAKHYLGRPDWESSPMRKALDNGASLEAHTLGVLAQRGMLEPIDGDRDLGPGVRIIAAPGESPGHQIVRFASAGQTLYCVGDLYHHPMEAEQPATMVWWADPAATLRTRERLSSAALQERAIIIATHIPTIGRLERDAGDVVWIAV